LLIRSKAAELERQPYVLFLYCGLFIRSKAAELERQPCVFISTFITPG
jgi:hypothetical protein